MADLSLFIDALSSSRCVASPFTIFGIRRNVDLLVMDPWDRKSSLWFEQAQTFRCFSLGSRATSREVIAVRRVSLARPAPVDLKTPRPPSLTSNLLRPQLPPLSLTDTLLEFSFSFLRHLPSLSYPLSILERSSEAHSLLIVVPPLSFNPPTALLPRSLDLPLSISSFESSPSFPMSTSTQQHYQHHSGPSSSPQRAAPPPPQRTRTRPTEYPQHHQQERQPRGSSEQQTRPTETRPLKKQGSERRTEDVKRIGPWKIGRTIGKGSSGQSTGHFSRSDPGRT